MFLRISDRCVVYPSILPCHTLYRPMLASNRSAYRMCKYGSSFSSFALCIQCIRHDVTGYMVLYTQNPDLPLEEWQVKSVAGPETQTSLANLTLNVTYHLRVQARNSIGYSPFSSNTVFYSKPAVSPGFSFTTFPVQLVAYISVIVWNYRR